MLVSIMERKRGIFYYLINRKKGNRNCPIAKEKGRRGHRRAWSDCLHHRFANTKAHRRLVPLFIDSMLNLLPVNNAWHLQWPSFRRIRRPVAFKREMFLRRHPVMAAFVTGRIITMAGEYGKWETRYRDDGRPYLERMAA